MDDAPRLPRNLFPAVWPTDNHELDLSDRVADWIVGRVGLRAVRDDTHRNEGGPDSNGCSALSLIRIVASRHRNGRGGPGCSATCGLAGSQTRAGQLLCLDGCLDLDGVRTRVLHGAGRC